MVPTRKRQRGSKNKRALDINKRYKGYAYDPWEFHKIVIRGNDGAYPFKVLTNVTISTLLEIYTERYSMTQTKKFENWPAIQPSILSDSSKTNTSR